MPLNRTAAALGGYGLAFFTSVFLAAAFNWPFAETVFVGTGVGGAVAFGLLLVILRWASHLRSGRREIVQVAVISVVVLATLIAIVLLSMLMMVAGD